MPFETRYYNLKAFRWGEVYSSRVDQERFTIIDNQLAFLSDMVGSGVIFGWGLTNNEDGTVSIAPGMGIINRRVVQSFGGLEVNLSNNSIHYLYMEVKEGEVGGTSGNSNMTSVVAVDSVAPLSPTGLAEETSIISYLASLSSYDSDFLGYLRRLLGRQQEDDSLELIPYKEIAFSWDSNAEPDFSHYKISRFDGSDIEVLGTTTELIYADTGLEQNCTYSYSVVSVDLSGNESDPSNIDITTAEDQRIPPPPIFVQLFPGNEVLEVIWNHSPIDNVFSYQVVVQPLDADYNNDGDPTTVEVDSTLDLELGSSYVVFENLENNRNYDITVYAVPVGGESYKSDGVTVRTNLKYLPGAGEINDIDASFTISSFENVGLETTLIWRYDQDPYLPYAHKFLITFIENSSRFSEPIETLESVSRLGSCPDENNNEGICYRLAIKYIPYVIDGEIRYESIKEYTSYLILIQTEDIDGNISNGFISRISRTPVSETLSAITDFSIDKKTDNSIFLSWVNPTENYFSHNLITISTLDLADADAEEVMYVEDLRIDRADTFIIPSDMFNVDYRYTITIIPYNVFGDDGEQYQELQQFTAGDERLRPSLPSDVQLFAGDTQLYLKWNPDTNNEELEFYKIYRADFQYYLRSSDFSLIATIPSTQNEFIDYTVSNGTSYSYFITAADVYGIESLNPVDDDYMPPMLTSGTPSESLSLSAPQGLIANANSNDADVELIWEISAGSFDGYEILRSDGNNYSFAVVDNVPVSQMTYIDTNALLKDGETYYYLIRKYKNEVDIDVFSSTVSSSNSIFIGKVTTSKGVRSVDIDITDVVNLENFEDPIIEKTELALETHHHVDDGVTDKRIELRSSVYISDWTTVDYRTYSTTQDVEGATSYILRISGTLNQAYFTDSNDNVDTARLRQAQAGESPVLYEIDGENGKIVFNSPLYSIESSFVAPYSEIPSVSLELVGISEVDNYLPSVNVGNISATQFESGQFDLTQMPSVQHEGRKNESLLPLRLPMKTLDNFVYSLAGTYEDTDRNRMGNSVTFYDIIAISDERILAATSSGIWLSDNYGNDWEQVFSFSVAVHRLYKSAAEDYYAITNYGVYKNDGTSFKTWNEMDGLAYVKVIRDIAEDDDGNLYITTDLGVFRLNSESIPYIEDTWEKLSIFGPRSSEAYGILYEDDYIDGSVGLTGRILVSNELGLLQSVDGGVIWTYISDLESLIKIRKFVKTNNYIFGLSDTAIYREKAGETEFVEVASIDANISRKMEIFNNIIYITTDNGAKASVSSDIYNDNDIEFVATWPLTNVNNNTVMTTSINIIFNDLFIGTDKKVYIFNKNRELWLQFEQKGTVIPTVYVDNEIQKIGYYYNNETTSHNVSFDEIIDHEATVKISNKYDIYASEYGGWAHNKYNAKFRVYRNETQFGESRDDIELTTTPFVDVTLPTYDDSNAHEVQADVYKAQVEENLTQITAVEPVTGEALVDLVSDTYNKFELFLSQLYDDVKSDFVLPEITTDLVTKRTSVSNFGVSTDIEESVYATINADRGTSYEVSINVVNGVFVFDLPFDRYDILTIDIDDVTIKNAGENSHREIEDSFENIYSGPPSYLSQVQQINLVKLGVFTEKKWPGQRNSLSPAWQLRTIIPNDDDWYDTLNSTINYTEEMSNEDTNLSLSYPSTIAYVTSTGNVLVGGHKGALSINKDTLEISEIDFTSDSNVMVRSILQNNDNIYILTDKYLYMSIDDGITWEEYNRSGLPNQLYSIGVVNSNLVIGASDGIYIKLSDSETVDWQKVKDSNAPVIVMHSSNILFVVIDKNIYLSSNGFNYTDTQIGSDLDITNINRHGYVTTYISTNQGLYSDNGTFNSLSPRIEEIDLADLLTSTTISTVNDVASNNSDKLVVGVSSGQYGLIQNNVLKIKESTSLDSIHRVIFVDDDIWLFGQGVFKIPSLDYPIALSTGAPL